MEIKGDNLVGSDGKVLEMDGMLEKYAELAALLPSESPLISGMLLTGMMFEHSKLMKSMPSNEFRTKFLELAMETHLLVVADMEKAKEKHN